MTAVEHDTFACTPAAAMYARVAELPPDWQLAQADVLVGPPGVFLLDAAYYPQARVCVRDSAFLVDGGERPDIEQTGAAVRRLAQALATALDIAVPVRGVIVVVGAEGGCTVKEQPRDGVVKIVTCKTLTMYLHSLARRLDAAARGRVTDAVTEAVAEAVGATVRTPSRGRA